jgi:hypothetical protein
MGCIVAPLSTLFSSDVSALDESREIGRARKARLLLRPAEEPMSRPASSFLRVSAFALDFPQ